MFDPKMIKLELVPHFMRLARTAEKAGYAIGSTSEQIVAALLNKRTEWLPPSYPTPLEAIVRLNQGGADWWHTLLYVNERGWRVDYEMYEERL